MLTEEVDTSPGCGGGDKINSVQRVDASLSHPLADPENNILNGPDNKICKLKGDKKTVAVKPTNINLIDMKESLSKIEDQTVIISNEDLQNQVDQIEINGCNSPKESCPDSCNGYSDDLEEIGNLINNIFRLSY